MPLSLHLSTCSQRNIIKLINEFITLVQNICEMIRFVLFIFAIATFFTFNSCKIEGCTDNTAINYESKANEDDGSCNYEGHAIFWVDSTFAFNDITIVLNDDTIGVIEGYFTKEPECGVPQGVNITLEPGHYDFIAIDSLGATWNSSIPIEKNECTAQQIILDSLN